MQGIAQFTAAMALLINNDWQHGVKLSSKLINKFNRNLGAHLFKKGNTNRADLANLIMEMK